MLGFGAIGQFAIGEAGNFTAETITADKWYMALSEPVRVKPALKAGLHQYTSLNPLPLVSFSWFEGLSEPVRIKPINPAALRQDFFMQPAPSPFVATGWYNWLSEPVRLPNGLKFYLQREFTRDAVWIPSPATLIDGWYTWLSEPKRFPRGLATQLQQDLAYHPRILPPSNVTVIVHALEINSDAAAIAVNVVTSNPAVSAKASLIEIGNGFSATSVIEH